MSNKINPKWEEQILVSPRSQVFENGTLAFQGVETDSYKVDKILDNISKNLHVMRRGATSDPTPKENNAEINTDFKQPIPYVMIKRGKEIYVYERLSQGGESRLHNKLSLGIGGHMNLEEGSFNDQLMINTTRELEEELDIDAERATMKYIGLINDDEDEVGRVHIGILAFLELSEDATVEVRETDQLRGFWSTVEELKKTEVYERLESWSQIAVNILK